MIICIVGTLASGKSSVARIIEEQGFTRISLSDLLREVASRKNLDDTHEVLVGLANELRDKYGPGALMQEALHRMRAPGDYVVEAIHNEVEIELLRQLGAVHVIGVDADPERRYLRAVERQAQSGKDERASTKREFLATDVDEGGRALLGIAETVIVNDGTPDELRAEVLRALPSRKPHKLPSRRRS